MSRKQETKELIKLAGGQSEIARNIKPTKQSVQQWSAIPEKYMPSIRILIKKRYKAYTKLYDKYFK